MMHKHHRKRMRHWLQENLPQWTPMEEFLLHESNFVSMNDTRRVFVEIHWHAKCHWCMFSWDYILKHYLFLKIKYLTKSYKKKW